MFLHNNDELGVVMSPQILMALRQRRVLGTGKVVGPGAQAFKRRQAQRKKFIQTAVTVKAVTRGDPEAYRRKLMELSPAEVEAVLATNLKEAKDNVSNIRNRIAYVEKITRQAIFDAKKEGMREDIPDIKKDARIALQILNKQLTDAIAFLRVREDDVRARKLKKDLRRTASGLERAKAKKRIELYKERRISNREVAEERLDIEFAPIGEKMTRDSILPEKEMNAILAPQREEVSTEFLPEAGEEEGVVSMEPVGQQRKQQVPQYRRQKPLITPKVAVAGGAGLLTLLLLL